MPAAFCPLLLLLPGMHQHIGAAEDPARILNLPQSALQLVLVPDLQQ
jgi:hypothetical protein